MRLAGQNEVNAAVEGTASSVVTTVSIVRRPRDLELDSELMEAELCRLEGIAVESLVVVKPADSHTHETVIIPIAAEEADSADTDGDPDGALEPLLLPGTARADADSGPPMQMSACAPALLSLPFAAFPPCCLLVFSACRALTQLPIAVDVVVPPDGQPGQEITLQLGGLPVTVTLPLSIVAGQRVQVAVPLPAIETIVETRGSGSSIWVQIHALIYKDIIITLGCRRQPGLRGCFSLKCLELVFYVLLFMIMAGIALWNSFLYSVNQSEGGACSTGALNLSYTATSETGWDYIDADVGQGYSEQGPIQSPYGSNYHHPYSGYGHYGYNIDTTQIIRSCDVAAVANRLVHFGADHRDSNAVWSSCEEGEGWREDSSGSCWLDIISHGYTQRYDSAARTGSPTCGLTRELAQNIWFTEAPAGSAKLSQFRLFPEASGLQFTQNGRPAVSFVPVEAGQVNARVIAAQTEVRDSSSQDVCATRRRNNLDALNLVDTFNESALWIQRMIPSFALELRQTLLRPESVRLYYTVRLWTWQQDDYYRRPFEYLSPYYLSEPMGYNRESAWHCSKIHVCLSGTVTSGADRDLQAIVSAMSNTVLRTVVPSGPALKVRIVPMPPMPFSPFLADTRPSPTLVPWFVMYPLLTMLPVPSLAAMLASEQEHGLIDVYRSEGGRLDAYVLGNGLFCFIYSICFSTGFVLVMQSSGATDGDSAVHMPGPEVAMLVVCGAFAQTGFVCFIGLVVFKRARNSAIFGVLSVLMTSVLAMIITMLTQGATLPLPPLLFPPIAYARTACMMLWRGGGAEFERGLLILMVDALLYFGAAVAYLAWPSGLARRALGKRRLQSTDTEMLDFVTTGGGVSELFNGDDDVEAERLRVHQAGGAPIGDSAIVMDRLVKNYTAVSNGRSVSSQLQ